MRNTTLLSAIVTLAAIPVLSACTGDDASIHLNWTINGGDANTTSCGDVGAVWVQIDIDDDLDGNADRYSRDFPCSNGGGETFKIFDSAEEYQIKVKLEGGGEVKDWWPDTGWHSFTPDPGSNTLDIPFTITP